MIREIKMKSIINNVEVIAQLRDVDSEMLQLAYDTHKVFDIEENGVRFGSRLYSKEEILNMTDMDIFRIEHNPVHARLLSNLKKDCPEVRGRPG